MKRTGIAASVVIIAFISAFALFNRCAGGDMATVTINFGETITSNNIIQKKTWDSIVNFILPKAFAQKGDPWDPTHTSVIITVSGPGMSDIQVSVPPYTSSRTLEIPAGNGRRITVIAYNGTARNTGGHTVIDLNAGDNIITQIQLLPILPIVSSPYGTGSLAWDYPDSIPGITVYEYYIYESGTINGTYVQSGTEVANECSFCGTAGNYYKVSAVFNTYGEGELSDPYLMP